MTPEDGNGRATGPIGYERGDTPGRPPVLLGCAALVGIVVLLVIAGACAVVFLESGADSGTVVLEDADAYAPGSIDYNGEFNFFVVRDGSGEYYALDDLDAANRANQSRRCRVQALPSAAPEFTRARTEHAAAFSAAGRGLGFIFREDCNSALYDGTGVRLDAPGERNLDRFEVGEAPSGRLEVSLGERVCTRREGENVYAPVECE